MFEKIRVLKYEKEIIRIRKEWDKSLLLGLFLGGIKENMAQDVLFGKISLENYEKLSKKCLTN